MTQNRLVSGKIKKTWMAMLMGLASVGLASCDSELAVMNDNVLVAPPTAPLVLSGPDQRCDAGPGGQSQICFEFSRYGNKQTESVHGVSGQVVWFVQENAIWGRGNGQERFVQSYRDDRAKLHSVYAVARDVAWAVGSWVENNTASGLVLRWDGTMWKRLEGLPEALFVRGVYAAGRDDAWLAAYDASVGDGFIFSIKKGLLKKEYQIDKQRLSSVWGIGSKDVYAVGERGLIAHYDGTKWSRMDSGEPNVNFEAVWGAASNDVYAVGNNGAVVHYDGSKWKRVYTDERKMDFIGVWGSSAQDLYVVSLSGMLHYDGVQWSVDRNVYQRKGVWGTASNDVYVVGNNWVTHYDGQKWSSPNDVLPSAFRGIWGAASNDVYAVGEHSVLHHDGQKWSEVYVASAQLNAVWGSGPNDVYAAGEKGVLVHYNGQKWEMIATSQTDAIQAIWGSGSNDVYAVGWGDMLHFDGTVWTKVTAGMGSTPPRSSFAIWGSGPKDVYVGGLFGSIAHWDGTSWSTMTVPPPSDPNRVRENIRAIWGTASNNVYATASNGDILHYDGTMWSIVYNESKRFFARFFAMWGTGPKDVYAVGENGAVVKYDGINWSTVLVSGTNFFKGIWGIGQDDPYIVGDHGEILRLKKTVAN